MISWQNFFKVDIGVGTITTADHFPEAFKPAITLWKIANFLSGMLVTRVADEGNDVVLCASDAPARNGLRLF